MPAKRFARPFRRLRGKLTLSYTLTSVLTFLLVELIVIPAILAYVNVNAQDIVLNDLKQVTPQAGPYFMNGSPDHQALVAWLNIINKQLSNQGPFSDHPIFLTIVDREGKAVASVGAQPPPDGTKLATLLTPTSSTNLNRVLADVTGNTNAVSLETENTLVAISAIASDRNNLLGAVVLKNTRPDILQVAWVFLRVIIFTIILVTTIAAVAGMVFGYLTARSLTRRLARLSEASDRWSRGDFSTPAEDTSEDELGQTARQLNRMAEQLQNLLEARRKLATLEERNRLARDLHDSVKQQVFALAMQIGATKALLKSDQSAAEARLNEADNLVRQTQQELTTLIRELRPAALEGKGLITALRETCVQWAQQTGKVANLEVEGTQPIPSEVEDGLFRVAQEALANVSRHSNATLVQLLLSITDSNVTLTVRDNGQGFDIENQPVGVGLLSMRERMLALGGDVELTSVTGEGTQIIAHCKRRE